MPVVVSMDKAGRIVIPKGTRDAQGLVPGTQFLLVEGRDGRLWLQRLNAKELARRIEDELRGIDLKPVIEKIRSETEGFARTRHPASRD